MTMFEEGHAGKNYNASDNFYYSYSKLIEKLSKLDNHFIIDTTP